MKKKYLIISISNYEGRLVCKDNELPLPCGAVAPMEVVSNSRNSYPFLTKKNLAIRTN